MKIVIFGYGVVGKHVESIFPITNDDIDIWIYDPYKGLSDLPEKYDFAIICVPTELIDGKCDISIVEKAINESNAKMNIIKSTIPPGTTDYLISKYNKDIVFNPEFSGASLHAKAINENFIILGGERCRTTVVAEMYKQIITGHNRIMQTTSKTAELVKYMDNSFLGCKVVFCNEFYRIAESMGIDYNEMRELFLMDNRVNPSHTLVYKAKPYYDSHCLNKDISAVIGFCENYNPEFIKDIVKNNERFKNE